MTTAAIVIITLLSLIGLIGIIFLLVYLFENEILMDAEDLFMALLYPFVILFFPFIWLFFKIKEKIQDKKKQKEWK